MQRPSTGDSCSSSFTSSDLDHPDLDQQEAMLVEKYGRLKLKQSLFIKKQSGRKFFDSADWSLQKEGKLAAADTLLDYACPIDQLPVKSEPTVAPPRHRSNMDTVGLPQPQLLASTTVQVRTVLDI